MELPFTEEERATLPKEVLSATDRQGWYEDIWTEAHVPKSQSLEEWAAALASDSHKPLYAFLQAIWDRILMPSAQMAPADAEEAARFTQEQEEANALKGDLAESIIAAAQRVGGRGRSDLSPHFLSSLMGTIKANPAAYARAFGKVMGDPAIEAPKG
jgi:hypothetical protein